MFQDSIFVKQNFHDMEVKQEQHFEEYMRQCITLAETALKSGNPPVGSIIVCDGKVIGKGIESGKTTGDVTNHAEILAVKDAINGGHIHLLTQAQMFSTHEPCIMCSYVIRQHKIPHIIYGTAVPGIGGATSKFNVLTTEEVLQWGKGPKITKGISANECDGLTARYAIERKRNKINQFQ